MMTDDAKVQELIKQGVSKKELIINPGRFEKCTLCRLTFNENIQPKLLNCGHLICTQCLIEEKRCFYPGCNNTSPIIMPYSLNKNKNVTENSIFRFILGFALKNKEIRKEVKGSMTIRQIIQNPYFDEYINYFGENKVVVILGSKQTYLNKIIDSKIIDLSKEYNLNPEENAYIPLRINERYLGGMNE